MNMEQDLKNPINYRKLVLLGMIIVAVLVIIDLMNIGLTVEKFIMSLLFFSIIVFLALFSSIFIYHRYGKNVLLSVSSGVILSSLDSYFFGLDLIKFIILYIIFTIIIVTFVFIISKIFEKIRGVNPDNFESSYILCMSLAIFLSWMNYEIYKTSVDIFVSNGILTLVNGMSFSMLLFLMTAGFFLIFGLAGIINFSHGAFFMLGGFMGYEVYLFSATILANFPFLSTNQWLLSFVCFIIALLGAASILGLFGAVIEVTTIRKLFGNHISQILLTTGFLFIILQITEILWGPDPPFQYNYASGTESFLGVKVSLTEFWLPRSAIITIGSVNIELYRIFIILFGLMIAGGLFLILNKTRIGLIITAGIEDPEMVQALGINTKLVFTLVFAVGASLAGLAGAAAVPQVNASLTVAGNYLIYAFIIVVIGGAHFGRLSGTFFASLIVGLSFTFCQFFFPGLESIIIFLILLIMLIFRPGGLTGEPM